MQWLQRLHFPNQTQLIIDRLSISLVFFSQVPALAGIKFKPTGADCDNYKKIDFKMFTSTWLSVSPSGIEYVNNQVTLSE